mmetsp:Transcript_19697/g.74561  ORF Transcript_19697/g.74561 Transcript_19697/m.74561 type:complete len:465 (-) Transcript_19697:182-1576(-)
MDAWSGIAGRPLSSVRSLLARGAVRLELALQRVVRFEAHGVDADEALGICWIVVESFSAAVNVHRRQVRAVQRVGAVPANNGHVPLVQFQVNFSRDVALREVDGVHHEVHLRRKPEAIVAEDGELLRQLVADAQHFAVDAHSLKIQVRLAEDGAARRLVDAARLDADEAVFDDVDATDAVLTGHLVEVEEKRQGLRVDHLGVLVRDLDRHAVEELDAKALRGVRCVLRVPGHLEHLWRRGRHGILQHAALVGRVVQVLVHGVRRLGRGVDGDAVLGGVRKEILAALELLKELGVTPGRDGHEVGVQRLRAHLEAHLVVALAGRSVGQVLGAFDLRNLHLLLGDARPRQARPQHIPALVHGVGLHGGPDVAGDEILTKILDVALGCAALERLRTDLGEVLLELAHIGAVADHFKAFFHQPHQDDAGVQATAVGQHAFLLLLRHGYHAQALEGRHAMREVNHRLGC